jgi:hypothetical protein
MITFLVILALAWLFAPLFSAIFGVLAVFFIPALLAGLITSVFPWIPFGLAYFGVMALLIYSTWKDLPGRKASSCLETPYQPPLRPRAIDRLTPGPRDRQKLTGEELEFIDSCRAVVQGSDSEALLHLRKVSRLADAAFLAGLMALKMNRPEEASAYLSSITDRVGELDRYISKAGITVTVRLPITEDVSTMVVPDMRGVLLALAQAYMKEMRWRDALAQLERLRSLEPNDTAVRLAMVEWLLKARPGERESCEEIIRLTDGGECDSTLEAALLLDRARAQKTLGRIREARNALDKVLCSAKVRHPELLDAACRERDSLEESR